MAIKKHHQRTIDRVHLLVRMELAYPLMNASDIASLVGLTIQRYSVLKAHNLYKTIKNQYMSGIMTRLDTQVSEALNLRQTRAVLEVSVPLAMQTLLQQVSQTKDERIRNKAANDILDRHGVFAKVTRVAGATAEQGGVGDEKDNKVAAEMLKAMQNGGRPAATINDPPISEISQ